jgi:aminoglycoside phosphotransferase (APT) family kinase protein
VPAKDIGQQLGEFLSVLHALPTDSIRAECPALHIETDNLFTSLEQANKQYLAVKESVPPNLRAHCESFLSIDDPPDLPQLPFCLIHHDFRMEHVLYNMETGGIGIIDWGDTCIANPLGDFVGIWMWGGDEMTRNALSVYSRNLTEEHLPAIRFMGLCVAFDEIEYGLAVSSDHSIRLGITALEHAFTR